MENEFHVEQIATQKTNIEGAEKTPVEPVELVVEPVVEPVVEFFYTLKYQFLLIQLFEVIFPLK